MSQPFTVDGPAPASGVVRVVGFSGGIDSQATALWVRERFPAEEVLLLNTTAGGNEHETTTRFIEWYSANVFPVTVIPALIRDLAEYGTKSGRAKARRDEFKDDDELTFERLAYIKGRFPSSQSQFCTMTLKLEPQRRWCLENLIARGLDVVRYVGVRRDESRDRKDTPDSCWDEFFDCEVCYPLAGQTKTWCFDYVTAAGEPYNPLYREGYSRVGCAPCVNWGKDDVRNIAARSPHHIDKIRGWERFAGRTFFPPCVPGMEINFIDDVVAWSRTSRGGKQIELPMLDSETAPAVCSSRYGLCE